MRVFSIVFPVVMVLDILLPFLLALPYKGYSPMKSTMSVIGCRQSPLGRVYSLWTILSGIVFVWAGLVMYVEHPGHPVLRVLLLVLLALYGIGCEIISGLFPVGETKDDMRTPAKIHGVGSVIGFMALLFSPLVLGIVQLRDGGTMAGVFSLVCFVLALAAFALFVMADKPRFRGTFLGNEGLWQRLALVFMYLPLFVWIV